MIIGKHIFVTIVTIFLLFSCTKDVLPPFETNCDEDISYDNQVAALINTTCAYNGCHDGSGSAPGDFRSYAALVPWLNPSKFEERTLISRDMPPNYADGPTSLTSEEIDLLRCWVLNNYNEN